MCSAPKALARLLSESNFFRFARAPVRPNGLLMHRNRRNIICSVAMGLGKVLLTKGNLMQTISFAKRALCVATLAVASFGAHANMTVNIGTVVPGTSFSQVIQQQVGGFIDKWNFTITQPTFSAGSVSNLAITVAPLGNLYNITGLSAQLYTSTNILVENLDTNPASTADLKVGSGLFTPGNYYFSLSGVGNGKFGGQYVFAVTTLPVPEPESYAMLLAGLGVMGAIAVRRKKSKQD